MANGTGEREGRYKNHDANKELSRDPLFGRLYSKEREWDEDGGRGPEESGIVVPYGKW